MMWSEEEQNVARWNLAVPSPIFRETDPILTAPIVRWWWKTVGKHNWSEYIITGGSTQLGSHAANTSDPSIRTTNG